MAPPDKSVHWKQGQHLCIVISDLCSSWLEVNNNHLFTLCTLRHERMMTEQASDQRQTRKHTYPHTTCLSLTLSVCRTSIGNRNITRFPTSLYSSLYSTVCCNHFTYVCAPCVMLRSYLRRCQLCPATWLGTNWEWVIFIACNCTHIWKYTVIWSGLIKKKVEILVCILSDCECLITELKLMTWSVGAGMFNVLQRCCLDFMSILGDFLCCIL